MALLDDIGTYLIADASLSSLSLVAGGNLWLGLMPDHDGVADAVFALFEGGGMGPVYTQGPTNLTPAMERPRLMVQARGAELDYAPTKDNIYLIWKSLQKVVNQTLTSTLYYRVSAVDSPHLITRDSSRRVLFSANFDVEVAAR